MPKLGLCMVCISAIAWPPMIASGSTPTAPCTGCRLDPERPVPVERVSIADGEEGLAQHLGPRLDAESRSGRGLHPSVLTPRSVFRGGHGHV